MLRKVIFAFALVLVATLVYGGYYLSGMMSAGSGFSAKNICSGFFLSDMPAQQIVNEALIPAAPILSNISYEIDEENKRVDTRLFGLFQRRAVFNRATGCTLLRAGRDNTRWKLEALESGEMDTALP